MATDLGHFVDVRFDVQEVELVTQFHGAKCEGLTDATDYCNFVADGANLCVESHSKQWWSYVACMYEHVDPNGDATMDVNNPLAHIETFDKAMVGCATGLMDYTVEELRACVYGDEAAALRNASAAKTLADLNAGRPPIVWIDVDGKFVQAPEVKNDTRSEWKASVVAAICDGLRERGVLHKQCVSEAVV